MELGWRHFSDCYSAPRPPAGRPGRVSDSAGLAFDPDFGRPVGRLGCPVDSADRSDWFDGSPYESPWGFDALVTATNAAVFLRRLKNRRCGAAMFTLVHIPKATSVANVRVYAARPDQKMSNEIAIGSMLRYLAASMEANVSKTAVAMCARRTDQIMATRAYGKFQRPPRSVWIGGHRSSLDDERYSRQAMAHPQPVPREDADRSRTS